MLIGFSGTQCCGKSTLLKILKEKNPGWNIILGEEGVVRKLRSDYDIKINEKGDVITQTMIMSQHIRNIFDNKDKNAMFDRCVLDSFVYSTYVACIGKIEGNDFDDVMLAYKISEHIFRKFWNKYDLIFILDPADVELKEDGVRSTDEKFRRAIHELFLMAIEHFNMENVVLVNGTIEERLEIIKQHIDKIGDINLII